MPAGRSQEAQARNDRDCQADCQAIRRDCEGCVALSTSDNVTGLQATSKPCGLQAIWLSHQPLC